MSRKIAFDGANIWVTNSGDRTVKQTADERWEGAWNFHGGERHRRFGV